MEVVLALGGGGFRGVAHLGALEALLTLGVEVKAVAGTSVGGLIGAAYAAGNKPLAILNEIKKLDRATAFRRSAKSGPSLLGNGGVLDTLSVLLGEKTFSDLSIPFACTATDLNTAREIYLTKGKVIDACVATMAFPGVLPPVHTGTSLLVDGGVVDPIPVSLARHLAPNLPVIAIALTPAPQEWGKINAQQVEPSPSPKSIKDVLMENLAHQPIGQLLNISSKSLDISSMMLTELQINIAKPDVVLRPDVVHYAMFEIVDSFGLFQAGEQAVLQKVDEIKQLATWRGRIQRFVRQATPAVGPEILGELPLYEEAKPPPLPVPQDPPPQT